MEISNCCISANARNLFFFRRLFASTGPEHWELLGPLCLDGFLQVTPLAWRLQGSWTSYTSALDSQGQCLKRERQDKMYSV